MFSWTKIEFLIFLHGKKLHKIEVIFFLIWVDFCGGLKLGFFKG